MTKHVLIPPVCLVMVQPGLVAKDIALTITDHTPTAQVLLSQSCDQALAALAEVPALWIAFLAMTPDQLRASPLSVAIRNRGGFVVLLSDAAEQTGPSADWGVLARPFITDHVVTLLAGRA